MKLNRITSPGSVSSILQGECLFLNFLYCDVGNYESGQTIATLGGGGQFNESVVSKK